MSITVTTDVFCDKCPRWVHGVVAHKKMTQLAREEAREQGWVRQYDHKTNTWLDVCYECKSEVYR